MTDVHRTETNARIAARLSAAHIARRRIVRGDFCLFLDKLVHAIVWYGSVMLIWVWNMAYGRSKANLCPACTYVRVHTVGI